MSDYLENLKKRLQGQPEQNNTGMDYKSSPTEAFKVEVAANTSAATSAPTEAELKPKEDIKAPKQFFLTQSLIKDITTWNGEYNEVCPRLIYEKFITGAYRYTTDSMLEGIFGETKVLGGGARGQEVHDLPRHKKTGEKLTAQKNIEEQSKRFDYWCASKGISVIRGVNTQVPIVKAFNDKIFIRTEIDLFPSPFLYKGEFRLAVMDIKFTGDINNTSGNFSWGAPQFIDHLQADMTYWLLEDFDMELNIKHAPHKEEVYKTIFGNDTITNIIKNRELMFVYFIMGYKKQPLEEQILFLHREYYEPGESRSPTSVPKRQREWKERGRKTLAQLNMWHQQNWKPEPGNQCVKCPVNKINGGYCDKAPELRTI